MEKQQMVFLILQFLQETGLTETLHSLESDSGLYFDMIYFREILTQGKWEEADQYLSGFTKVDENEHSWKLFFEIRKQKYLEALDKCDHAKAVEILRNELKVFSTDNKNVFEGLSLLLTLDNIRARERERAKDGTLQLFDAHRTCDTNHSQQNVVNQRLGSEQARSTSKLSNPFTSTLAGNTRDQSVVVEDAINRARERERAKDGTLQLFDAHRTCETNHSQQNVVNQRLGSEQARRTSKRSNPFTSTLAGNTRDQPVVVEDAINRARERERAKDGTLHSFDAHRTYDTNPSQQNVVIQSLGSEQARRTYKLSNPITSTLAGNTRDQSVVVEDAINRARERERAKDGTLHLFDAHRTYDTNPSQQNVARESKEEKENAEYIASKTMDRYNT